ncbi:phosphotransferase family protein [Nocardioides halotolerans]|uniref:phosphotransferase family protein n=1 Tax=Nocardioides halotolerans TaxID=433660 RepID=UPI0003F9E5F7|nr:phosphotransferase [Nocardioides halotolerans]
MDFSSLTPLEGGWSGQTFVAETAGERSVVRIYPPGARPESAAEVDAAVLRLVRGLLPVPEVLEVRPGRPELDRPGLLVTSFLPGVRGDELLPTLDDAGLAAVGATLGACAADLGGMPMLRTGPFVDAQLAIGDFGVDGLAEYVELRLPELAHLSPDEIDGLREVAVTAQVLLDSVTRSCLVHSDLNPKNVLIDPGTLELTGVLDWEYAHAGHPFTDLGNLLRFDRAPAFERAVLAAYEERRGTPPQEALPLARAADLWALVDLATRRAANPVAARADGLLRAIARQRDTSAPEPARTDRTDRPTVASDST